MTATETRKYEVIGMSCNHCRSSVSEEIAGIDGVEQVEVDLASGVVEIQGFGIEDDRVAAAVVDAGYQLGQVE